MFLRFFPIIALTFVNVIGFSVLIPVLPTIAENYAPNSSEVVYGLLLSSYAFFQFLGAPILGSLSDKFGRKPLLLISQLGTTLSWVIFASAYFAPNILIGSIPLPLLIIALSRITDGLTGGNISVAQAWISDVTTRAEKTKAFGMIGAIFGLGFLFGPALGGLTSSGSIGYLGTCIVAFLISFVTLIVMFFFLPESLPHEKRDHHLEIHLLKEMNIWHKLQVFKHNIFVQQLLIIRVAFLFVFGAFFTLIILYMRQAFHLTEQGLGLTMSVIGVFSILNQAILTPKISHKFGDLRTFYFSLIAFIIGLITIPFIPLDIKFGNISISFLMFLVNTYLINIGISLGMPTFKSILVSHVDEKRQGLATGIDESLIALGNSVTPIIAGILFSILGIKSFFIIGILLTIPHLYIWSKTGKLVPQE